MTHSFSLGLLFKDNKLTVFYDPAGGDVQEIIDIREILDGLNDMGNS